jgi:hypothetical protein
MTDPDADPLLEMLSAVLAAAFTPAWWPGTDRTLASRVFQRVLLRAADRGAIAYIPGLAVCVLTPPRGQRWPPINAMARLGRVCWRMSNVGAHPTGAGAGTVLLTEICDAADRMRIDLCLRAGPRSARLYRRMGFERTGRAVHGTVMLRRCRPEGPEEPGPGGLGSVRLTGSLAGLWDTGDPMRDTPSG